jgi:hypothetical protein
MLALLGGKKIAYPACIAMIDGLVRPQIASIAKMLGKIDAAGVAPTGLGLWSHSARSATHLYDRVSIDRMR